MPNASPCRTWSSLVGLCLLFAATSASAQAPRGALSPPLAAQLRLLQNEKAARSPVQRKIGSQLLYASRVRAGRPAVPGLAALRTRVEIDPRGRAQVDVRARVTRELRAIVEQLGGEIRYASRRGLRISIPIDAVEALAERDEVESVRSADRAYTRKLNTSEGDAAHRTSELRSALGVDGTGIQVGVLSDGVDSLAAVQATGDLPPSITVLPGQAGSGDEGTAMLEIVHDLAPGADLLFATAFTSQASFAANILALEAAGADVIVDDVGYFAESVFQDDDVAAAVDTVSAAGVAYFSSAGNAGNLNDGTSGVWEGDWLYSGQILNGHRIHDFGSGVTENVITLASPFVYTLHWSDPLGSSGADYDLVLLNSAGTAIVAASTSIQNGNDDPFEIIGAAPGDAGLRLLIMRSPGSAARHLHLSTNRGRLTVATAGHTSGHASARGAYAVAATDGRTWGFPFNGSESVQLYSSDGPRRVFFEADGSEITPGNLLGTGGEVRAKPDLTAADCVSTTAPGFSIFCGTSAAAPHAAAVAALLLDLQGSLTLAEMRTALQGTSLDIEAAGDDRDSGAGIVAAVAAAGSLVDCVFDSDCDDAVFCNGAETCVAGACDPGPGDPCAGGPDPFCDETGDVCLECIVDGDCDDATFCNGAETCVAGACDPGPGDPCAGGPDPFCDETGDVCLECIVDGDCDDATFCNGAETCVAGACDPGPGDPCAGGPDPFCDETGDVCLECIVDGDCDDATFCNGAETCVAGACDPGPGDPCAGGPDPFCDETGDVCFACFSGADCAEGEICSVGGACVVPVPSSEAPALALLALLLAAFGTHFIRRRRRG